MFSFGCKGEEYDIVNRREKTNETVQELFHKPASGNEGTDPEFMQILQGFIFGEVFVTGSLNGRMRELVTITVLTAIQALPQLKSHLTACLNVGCTPTELREVIYQCAPFLGFPRTLNAIDVMNKVFQSIGIQLPLPRQGTLDSDEERYERGLAVQEALCDSAGEERYTWLPGPFAQAVPCFLTELCYGDFHTRKGLEAKTRELLLVVLLAALGGAEVQLKSHISGALKLGCTAEEIVCALVHAGCYMGFPSLFQALDAGKELLEER